MITLSLVVIADGAVQRLSRAKAKLRAGMAKAVAEGANALLAAVREKLSGEVLHVDTGTLRDSIVVSRLSGGDEAFGVVISSDGSAPYARIQEFGGRIEIPAAVSTCARVLAFAYGGRTVFTRHTQAHSVTLPERSYLRSSAKERTQDIVDRIRRVATEAIA